MARPSKLKTPPPVMVLNALRKASKPLSAYEILEKLRQHGVKSPPIIYRALEALRKKGDIHRIEQLNAYVACNCESHHTHTLSVLTVCTQCQYVSEVHDENVIHHIEKLRKIGIKLPNEATLEIPIICKNCSAV